MKFINTAGSTRFSFTFLLICTVFFFYLVNVIFIFLLAEICTFWERLPSVEVENQMLSFPTEFRNIKEIFVRDAFDDLYNRYISQRHYVLVTGNPGTGKSYFSLYVLYRLRKERSDLVIVYVSAPSDIVVLFNGDTVSVANDEKELSFWLDKEDTIYLFDAGTQGARIPRVKKSKTIVFSSPSRSNYHDFYKECIISAGGKMVYMPIWSWDEINKLCVMKNFPSDKAKERFDHWGGIARSIFHPVEECDALEYADLDGAIHHCSPEKIIGLALTLKGGDIKLHSHKVLHMDVRNELPDGSLDYTTPVIYFASKYVSKRVFDKFTADTRKALINIINDSKHGLVSGIRGQLFECFAHCRFVNHDAEYDVKCLEPAHSMFNQVTKQKFGKLIETPLQNVAALASQKDQEGVYLKPVQQNFESLDAIIPPRVGIQMTVASSHPVKIVGLQKVIKALGCTEQEKFTLYFVVPRDAFDDYKKQRYHDNTKGQKDGIKKATEEIIEQWVLCMDLTPSP